MTTSFSTIIWRPWLNDGWLYAVATACHYTNISLVTLCCPVLMSPLLILLLWSRTSSSKMTHLFCYYMLVISLSWHWQKSMIDWSSSLAPQISTIVLLVCNVVASNIMLITTRQAVLTNIIGQNLLLLLLILFFLTLLIPRSSFLTY